jgi:outer membrane protein TolC
MAQQSVANAASSQTVSEQTTEPQARMIALADVAQFARENVPTVLVAMATARVAESQIGLARTAMQPTLSALIDGAAEFRTGPAATGGIATYTSTAVAGEGALNLSWTLWDFGRTALNVEAAERAYNSARQDVRAAERLAVSLAATAYYALLADEELVATTEETVRQRERELEITRGLVTGGARAQIERTRAQVALDTARLDLSTAQGAVLNDAAALASTLAIDPVIPLRVARPRELPIDDNPAHAADAAVDSRPEIAAARARVQAAESAVAAAYAGWRPSLFIRGNGTVQFIVSRTDSLGMSMNEVGPAFGAAGILGLNIPIFDPTVLANVRVAQAQLANARARVAQQVLAVRTDAVQAALGVRSARQAVAEAERLAAGAAANLQQAEGRYRAGAAPLLELVDAQAADAMARIAVIRVRFQLEAAKVRLLGSVGRLRDLEAR